MVHESFLAKERDPSSTTLRDALITTTFAPNRAINPTIQVLTLEDLSPEVTTLRGMIKENSLLEHGSIAIVTETKTLSILPIQTGGEEEVIHLKIDDPTVLQGIIQGNIHTGMVMHTHPLDLPLHVGELSDLFLSIKNPRLVTTEMVITPNRTLVMFRGRNTPEEDESWIVQKTREWDRKLEEKIARSIRPDMSLEAQEFIRKRLTGSFIKRAMEDVDLQLFAGEATSPTLKRISPADFKG